MFSEKIRFAITDDDPILIDHFIDLINDQDDIRIVGNYSNALETRHGLNGIHIDVLLLDIRMASIDGFSLLKELKYHHPGLHIVLLTTTEDISFIKPALKVGANGYLTRSPSNHSMVEALREVAKGRPFYHPEILKVLNLELATQTSNSSKKTKLSPLEMQILDLMSMEYSTTEIGLELNLSAATIENHRSHLFEKMNVENIAGLVRAAMDNGWI